MRIRSFASFVAQHPTPRPLNEIEVWAWIAGAILAVIVLGTALSPPSTKLASNAPLTTLMAPPAPQPLLPAKIISNPDL